MSTPIKLYIPDELLGRIDQKRGDQTIQEYTLAALRSAVHGSPVENELRRQISELLDIIRTLGTPVTAKPAQVERPVVQVAAKDERMGWG